MMYDVNQGRKPPLKTGIAIVALLAGCLPRGEGQKLSQALSPRPPGLAFQWAGDFSEGLAPVQIRGKFGFVDSAGRVVIAPAFAVAGGFSNRRAPVLIDGKWGYIDVTGRSAIAPLFDWAGAFHDGYAPVAISQGYLFIDTAGRPLSASVFAEARAFSGGFAAVKIGDGDSAAWGFIDRQGGLAIPPLFAGVPRGFSEGFAVVQVDADAPARVGYIDTSGGFAFDTLFDAAEDFSEGLAAVGRGRYRRGEFEGVWGFVDSSGRMAVPPAFAWAGEFRAGRALVRMQRGNYAFIGRDGKTVRAFPDSVAPMAPGFGDLVAFRSHAGYGFLDAEGSEAMPARFLDAGPFRDGWARARLAGSAGAFWVFVDRGGSYLGGTTQATETHRLPKAR